nr:probable helicase senataxin isoform X2 [Geotrypetes seraphini]
MEQVNQSFQVYDKHPGIYLLLVHPNEMIRRWAILTARTLGKVDRDDYYDLQEVFTCLFKVIELGLFENPDIYSFSEIAKGKLVLLPPHLYDTKNYKNYWLGICMLLSVLEEQAMDSLLLGPDKQNNFMQSILNTMVKKTDNDSTSPFWPALHCFMVILDQLGSKVWGQLIDPIEAFQNIINSPSYKNEIEHIRRSTIRMKCEPESNYSDDDIVSCSQIVYNYNAEKPKKDAGWKSAICPDYCPNLYEEMQTLTNVLQSDIGQDMRVHNSTFLWFIPFVQSVMDLKDFGVAYIVEVIHHLHSEIKDVLNRRVEHCDQVTEFFILILVSVIELHRNKKCLHLLWVSSQKWVEALVKCAMLPARDFRRHVEKTSTHCSKITSTTSSPTPTSVNSQAANSVQYACLQLIRSLLREGCQLGQQSTCKKFLDILNHLLRSSSFQTLILNEQETNGLESCLKQVIKNTKDRMSVMVSSPVEDNSGCKLSSSFFIKQENVEGDDYHMRAPSWNSSSLHQPSESRTNEVCQRSLYASRNLSFQEGPLETCSKDSKVCSETEHPFAQGNSGVSRSFENLKISDKVVTTSRNRDFQNTEQQESAKENAAENKSLSDDHISTSHQESASIGQSLWEGRHKEGTWGRESSNELDGEDSKPSSSLKCVIDSTKTKNLKTKLNTSSSQSRLSVVMDKFKNILKSKGANDTSDPDTQSGQSKTMNMNPANMRNNQINSALCIKTTSETYAQQNCGNEEKPTNKILTVSLNPIKLESDSLLKYSLSCTKLNETEKVSENDDVNSDTDDDVSLADIRNNLLKKCPTHFSNLPDTLGDKVPEKVALNIEQAKLESLSSRKDKIRDYADTGSDSAQDDSGLAYRKVKNKYLKVDSMPMNRKLDVSLCPLKSSDVDRNLDRLSLIAYAKGMNFPGDSSPETSASQLPDQVQRKMRVEGRFSVGEQSNCSSSDIKTLYEPIVISDSSDEERMHTAVSNERDCPVKQPSTSTCSSVSLERNVKDQIKVKCESLPMPCDEYDSQFFEFETENEVYSVWQDSQDYKKLIAIQKQEPCLSLAQGCSKENSDWVNQCNEWGYDTDYISDDLIEAAANAAEKELTSKGKATVNETLKESEFQLEGGSFYKESTAGKHLVHSFNHKLADQSKFKTNADIAAQSKANEVVPKKQKEQLADASKLNKEKRKNSTTCPGQKELVVAKSVRTGSKSPKKLNRVGRSSKIQVHQVSAQKLVPSRVLPAVVPPKKDRKCPEPASRVEKLGLKKAPRRAFEFSQRSLDSLAKLRSHGQAAGALEIKRKGKPILIAPLPVPVKGHKLLACQDLQFYRQTRPKKRVKEKDPGEGSKHRTKSVKSTVIEKPPRQESMSHELVKSAESWKPKTDSATSKLAPDSINEGKQLSRDTSVEHDIKSKNVSKMNENNNMALVEMNINMQENNTTEIFLNIPSHLSLPLNSLHEEEKSELNKNDEINTDNLFLTQLSPIDMELCSQEEDLDIKKDTTGDAIDLAKHISRTVSYESLCKQKGCTQTAEQPGIYCCKHSNLVTSNDQHFVKPDLPASLFKPHKPSTVKVFSTKMSSRNASLTKDLENFSKLPPAVKNKSQATRPMVPKSNESILTFGQNMIAQPLIHRASTAQCSRSEAGSAPSGTQGHHFSTFHHVNPPQRDQAFLVREILQWEYEMFSNFPHVGAPINVCQFDLTTVPPRFYDYENYFRVFFPLMMLNTFESLVQVWKERKNLTYELHRSSKIQMNPADYKVFIRDCDLNRQLHPREDDLVFLWEPHHQNIYSPNQGDLENPLRYYIGYVSRFNRSGATETRSKEQYVTCHLSIQTQSNFSNSSQKVNCEVIGSLVTTRRQFKALLQLLRSPLFKPIISPSPADFFPRDKINMPTEGSVLSRMRKYNEDQKKAIVTAFAMVKQHPKLPRICLIHGPPGTGKSETIVGFLQRILIENHGNEIAQNLNTKNKRNRVLVCAPSNAAIDELMKKIILGFKSRCRDKNNTLGNCGDINLVRLGSEKTIDKTVVKFSLDYRVNHTIEKAQLGRYQDFQKRKEELDRLLDELSRQRARERCNKSKECEILDERILRLSSERQQLTSKQKEMRPYEIQRTIILESHIICCTLNTSGSILLESAFRHLGHDPFNCVIVDEAGQACEVETLIPLIHRCSKLILVGDPEQLPPTVISKKAESVGYGKSLMARLCNSLDNEAQLGIEAKKAILQLTVQYRMHPDICLFPSNYIYGKLLKTYKGTEENRCSSAWPFQPYLLFDVSDGYEKRENESYCNPQEVKLTMKIIKVIKDRKTEMKGCSFGVITPYKAQKNMILHELKREFGETSSDTWQVDTVDGFQGREKDCVIVTCVRANATSGCIGFLDSRQRLNVTITRAKFSLFILGSLKTLMENQDWNNLIQDAQRRGAIIRTLEQNYWKHANRIQKPKPAPQHNVSHLTGAGLERGASCRSHGDTSHGVTSEFLNDLNRLSALPLSPAAPKPQPSMPRNGGFRPPMVPSALPLAPAAPKPQPSMLRNESFRPPMVPSAGDFEKVSVQTKAACTALVPPAMPEKPRDPRLAQKEKNANKDYARKINRAPSYLDAVVPLDLSRAAVHLGQGGNPEASSFNRPAQTVHPDQIMAPPATETSQAPREGNNQNKDCQIARKKPPDESLDRQDVKKRKLSL